MPDQEADGGQPAASGGPPPSDDHEVVEGRQGDGHPAPEAALTDHDVLSTCTG